MLIHDSATAQLEKDTEATLCINKLTQATHLTDNTIFSLDENKWLRVEPWTGLTPKKTLRKPSEAGLPFR